MFGILRNKTVDDVKIVTIYRPNDAFINITSKESAELAIHLATNPLIVYGFRRPTGLYLSDFQYDKMPDNIKEYFDSEEFELRENNG